VTGVQTCALPIYEDGFHDWSIRVACSGASHLDSHLLPNCTGTPVTTRALLFDGPDMKHDCSFRKVFSWREFQRWIGVPGKFPYTETEYAIVLFPRD
jgi:hypothetical protein